MDMQTCMETRRNTSTHASIPYVHTYMHYMHACVRQKHTHIYIHASRHMCLTCTHANTDACITYSHACIHAHSHIHAHTTHTTHTYTHIDVRCMHHIKKRTCMHAHMQTHAHVHAHKHTDTHAHPHAHINHTYA